jgi:hypothetical protein
MDLNVVDKFAELFAKCAAAGDSAPLRKEAAAQSLVKEAITASQLLMPLGGAALGGAAGYLGTDNEKRKLRNALYGALTGGVAGTGAQLAAPMVKDILSRFAGNSAPAAAAQGGGQFSVAPEQPASKATGAPNPAETAANEATKLRDAAPNDAGMPGAPMNVARIGGDIGIGAVSGQQLVNSIDRRVSDGGFYGRRRELQRLADNNKAVESLLYSFKDKSKPATAFLSPLPAAPATPTPRVHMNRAVYDRMPKAEQEAVVAQSLKYQAEQAARKAWEADNAERTRAPEYKQKQRVINNMRRTGSIGDMDESGWLSRLFGRSSRRDNLPVLAEALGTQGRKVDTNSLRRQLDGVRATRAVTGGRVLAHGLGGLAGFTAADVAQANMQNAAGAALKQNPNYGLGDLGKDIYGTGRDLVQQPAAFGKGLGAGLYDYYLRGLVENKK